jgi:glycosyltransferase involved in cell wall biosynthesis
LIQNTYKVVLFNDSLVGGAGSSILTLAEALRKNAIEVYIIICENKIDYVIPKDIPFYILFEKQFESYNKTECMKRLTEMLNSIGKCDMVISNSTPSNKILSLSKEQNIYHRIHSAEIKNYPDTIIGRLKYLFRQYKYKKLYSNKKLILVSKGLEKIIRKDIGATPASIDVIYNTLDLETVKYRAEEYCRDIPKEKYIIHVGRLDMSSKRHDILLKAYKNADVSHKLILLGRGKDEDKIRSIIKELQLEEKVILVGFRENPYPWIKHADLLLLTSDFEGFGMVLIEALCLRTPVVSTNCPSGPDEILTDELSDYLVPVQDIDKISKKIREALTSYPMICESKLKKYRADFIV